MQPCVVCGKDTQFPDGYCQECVEKIGGLWRERIIAEADKRGVKDVYDSFGRIDMDFLESSGIDRMKILGEIKQELIKEAEKYEKK
jgi:hypothetical protein